MPRWQINERNNEVKYISRYLLKYITQTTVMIRLPVCNIPEPTPFDSFLIIVVFFNF